MTRHDVPSVLLTVTFNGEQLFTKIWENPDSRSFRPIDLDSFWPAAQLTELVTAATVFDIVAETGDWTSLDRPVADLVSGLPPAYAASGLSLRDLLWHVSGLDRTDVHMWDKHPGGPLSGPSGVPHPLESWREALLHSGRMPELVRDPQLIPTATHFDIALAAAAAEGLLAEAGLPADFRARTEAMLGRLGMPDSTVYPLKFDFAGKDAGGRQLVLGHDFKGVPLTGAQGEMLNPPQHRQWPAMGMWTTGRDFVHLLEILSRPSTPERDTAEHDRAAHDALADGESGPVTVTTTKQVSEGAQAEAEAGDPVRLSLLTEAAFFGRRSRWSALAPDHPLNRLVPGVGAIWGEKEINGYHARFFSSRHIGHGAIVACVDETEPGDGTGEPYRVCLGATMNRPASHFADELVDSFFDVHFGSHHGCDRRGEDVPPNTGTVPPEELHQVLLDTRMTRGSAASVELPWSEERMYRVHIRPEDDDDEDGSHPKAASGKAASKRRSRLHTFLSPHGSEVSSSAGAPDPVDGAPEWAVRFPRSLVRINSNTPFAALPMDWLDDQPRPPPAALDVAVDADRATAAILYGDPDPSPVTAANKVETRTDLPPRPVWSTVYRNAPHPTISPRPGVVPIDGMHVAVMTATLLSCSVDTDDSCFWGGTIDTGTHSRWAEGKVRYVMSGRSALEAVSAPATRRVFLPTVICLLSAACVAVPALLVITDVRQRRAARRDEVRCSELMRGTAVDDVMRLCSPDASGPRRRQKAAAHTSSSGGNGLRRHRTARQAAADAASAAASPTTDAGFSAPVAASGGPMTGSPSSTLRLAAFPAASRSGEGSPTGTASGHPAGELASGEDQAETPLGGGDVFGFGFGSPASLDAADDPAPYLRNFDSSDALLFGRSSEICELSDTAFEPTSAGIHTAALWSDGVWADSSEPAHDPSPVPAPRTRLVSRTVSVGLPVAIALSSALLAGAYIGAYHALAVDVDTEFEVIPACWFDVAVGLKVALTAPYVALACVVGCATWWVIAVAFDTGVVPFIWITGTALGIVADAVVLAYAHIFQLFGFKV